jgi:beta-glucanase (GH16 family)
MTRQFSAIAEAAVLLVAVLLAPQAASAQAWQDDFDWPSLDPRWTLAGWGAPGYISGNHIGSYDANNVSLQSGYLVLRLTQTSGQVDNNPDGVLSSGALVATTGTFGYGTYEWRMRMSSTATDPTGVGSPVSGSVSAGFLYVNNSETEIDFEYGGHLIDDPIFPHSLYMVNWLNTDPSSDPTGAHQMFTVAQLPGINDVFHTYRFVWEPDKISFYVDDVLEAEHTANAPSAPAHFMINHWGTNNPNWGGEATLGVDRFFYIDWVSYAPLSDPDDTTPPLISNVASSGISASEATITWTTNEPSDSRVEYGETVAYGQTTTRSASLVTSHAQVLSGLSKGTTYHYRVHSRDAAPNPASSGDFTFTTKGKKKGGSDPPPPPPPDPGFTLSVTGQKVKGAKTVELNWGGATSDFVDIYRNGTPLITTGNDGSYIDSIGKGGGSTFTYQVCVAGTSTCSNQASVTL